MQAYNNQSFNQQNNINQSNDNSFVFSIIISAILLVGVITVIPSLVQEFRYFLEDVANYGAETSIYEFIWVLHYLGMLVGALMMGIHLVSKGKLNLLAIGALIFAAAELIILFYEFWFMIKSEEKTVYLSWGLIYLVATAAWGLFGALKITGREELVSKLKIVIVILAALSFLVSLFTTLYWYRADYIEGSFFEYYDVRYLIMDIVFPIALILIVLFIEGGANAPALQSAGWGGNKPPTPTSFPGGGWAGNNEPNGGGFASNAGGSAPNGGGFASNAGGGTSPQSSGGGLGAEQVQMLREYKGLLDDGIISQQEFDAVKKQMLG